MFKTLRNAIDYCIGQIKMDIHERRVMNEIRMIADVFMIDPLKTNAWKEIYVPYNPIVALDALEDLFENAYLRTPDTFTRRFMLLEYMVRTGDIEPQAVRNALLNFKQAERLFEIIGIDNASRLTVSPVGLWWGSKNDHEIDGPTTGPAI